VTGWRRIANAMWSALEDPQIFGELDIEAAAVMAVIERARAAGHRLTPTHLVGRAVAHALEVVPDLNVRIRGGCAYPRPSVDILFVTAVRGGHDLSGVKSVDVVPRRRGSGRLQGSRENANTRAGAAGLGPSLVR
jgi:pyruvate dehydrogenase E2 component (dihydrolipoamide acetyltransferase)